MNTTAAKRVIARDYAGMKFSRGEIALGGEFTSEGQLQSLKKVEN